MRGVSLLALIIALIYIEPLLARDCSSLFDQSRSTSSVTQNSFWDKAIQKTQDSKLLKTFKKIKSWSDSGKVIDLKISLSEVSSKDRMATLLYLLSSTKKGREIINKNIKNLTSYYDNTSGEIRSSIMVESRAIQGIGYFEVIEESNSSRLRLNKNLKLGTAVIVFGHELTHAYDFLLSKSYRKISDPDQRMLTTEYAAYMNEKLMIHEMLKDPEFKIYIESVKDDELNNLYTQNLNAREFARNMKASDNISTQKTMKFLKLQKDPNFEVPISGKSL